MITICPTVTAYDTHSFNRQLRAVSAFAERLHIDIMDGDFTPKSSPTLHDMHFPSDKALDIHVMYRRPQEIVRELVALKPKLVIIHAESDTDIPLFATAMREHGIQTGLALLPETSLDSIAQWLPHVQHLLIFGGKLGFHGGNADLEQLQKVHEAKKYSRHLTYGWDGGANTQNVLAIKNAGIDVINVGSGIQSADNPASRYKELVDIVS